ncbi:NADH dehydrogenase [ubiquinone] 1 alpha subcomplex assembly factor 2 [Bombina bombina]|uniref:NADH dehydrogenase [ubiquinone] 1 alpha subcomplex assembly factor 2 n=1 Tax=Bombina bombina TaxID=8345 RepID=UPI00235AE1A6|nr:NADH dehydrogenase [ubiquinone] 1 alpha subcomplex assembly factor 2 [Bombina bombina]
MDKLRALLQRALGTVRQHMGTDQFGNKYYYIPAQKTLTGQALRERRLVEPVNKSVHEYELGHIPTEWEAWIRGKRKSPPTIEEILKNEKFREEIKIKGVSFEKDQQTTSKDGLLQPGKTQIKGHASAVVYGEKTPSEEPTSTANTFEPGSWIPADKKNPKN